MKTTLDLPETLMQEVKLRASQAGLELDKAVADLLRKGLAAATASLPRQKSPRVSTDSQTGLPVIVCAPDAPAVSTTVEELLALEQQAQREEDLERLRLSL